MKELLDKISNLYETALREAIQSKTDPKCYALFIPYYGIGMDAEEAAEFSLVGEFLGENWMSKADNSIEPSLYTWGEFISEGEEVRLKNTELQKHMLEWHIYLESDEVEEEFDEYETVARQLGDVLADVCLRLNKEGFATDGNKLADDFVVFTDFMEPSVDMPGLGQCVSAEWLAIHKKNGTVADYIVQTGN